MSRPLFAVGEEVILCSKSYPQCSGEWVVERVVANSENYRCRISGRDRRFVGPRYGYNLSSKFVKENGIEALWLESALRKKHKPSDESFNEMMKNIKQNNKVTIGAGE